MTTQFHPDEKINGYIDTAINLVVRNLTYRQIGDSIISASNPLMPVEEHNLNFLTLILESIGDTSLYYLCTTTDISELWTRFRLHKLNEKIDVCEQIQMWALQWRLKSFTSHSEYENWLIELSNSFGSQHYSIAPKYTQYSKLFEDEGDFRDHAVVDDDMLERAPNSTTFFKMLVATPWFAFFITMHLGYTELLRDMSKNPLAIT